MTKKKRLAQFSDIFVSCGCKKISYMYYREFEQADYLLSFFIYSVKGKDSFEIRIEPVSKKLNEFCNFIAVYGSVQSGKTVKAPYPGHFKTSMSTHLTSAFSFGMYKFAQRVQNTDLSDHEFVKKAIKVGDQIFSNNPSLDIMIDSHLEHEIALPMRIAILLYRERFNEAREIVETCREQGGIILSSFPKQADQYLSDLGY